MMMVASSTDCEIRGVVWWIGVATLAALVVQLLSTVWRRRWLRGSVQWAAYRGDWAVVTGAAGGTGTALSEGLARRGLNLVLVSRNAEKLRLLADRLAKTHGVDVRVVVADFSKHSEAFEHIRGAVEGLCVSVLVNNAGGEPAMRTYLEMTAEEETRTWDTNVAMTLRLTRLLLPQMVSRHRGRVLCMSSLCSLFEGTLLVSYSSGKVYINQYCRALQSELRGTGVSVQAHVLGMVSTEGIANIPADGFHVVLPEVQAEASLRKLGSGGPVIVPVWSHALEAWALGLFPSWIGGPIFAFSSRMVQRKIQRYAKQKH